jgi:glycosyltransferase involved in cell wall biosynthesis
VYYAPVDEDYGYTAVETFQSERPVVTTSDAGGVLEFVVDGETGHVVPTEPREIAAAIDALATDEAACARLGRAGRQVVRDIRWETVVDKLTS